MSTRIFLPLIRMISTGSKSSCEAPRRPDLVDGRITPTRTAVPLVLGRWTLAATLSVGGMAIASNAEAAPSPGTQIRGRGGNFGIGLSLGDPMGLSMKYFMASRHAIQGDVGWAPLHHGDGRLGADYLFHPGTFVSNSAVDFLPYLGLGLGMMFWAGRYHHGRDHGHHGGGGVALFLRAPILGLGLHFKKAPLDLMAEGSWAPYLVLPDLAHGDFSIKVRYYF